MNTNTSMQARISAFVDGELSDTEVEAVLKDLQTPEGRAAWETYHRIGDVARTPEMDVPLSAGFSARMAARLDAEPTILAPAAQQQTSKQSGRMSRYAAPALAAVAVAALAFVVTPSMLKGFGGAQPAVAPAVVASASPNLSHASVIASVASARTGTADNGASAAGLADYVQAHQRLAPAFDNHTGSGLPAGSSGSAN